MQAASEALQRASLLLFDLHRHHSILQAARSAAAVAAGYVSAAAACILITAALYAAIKFIIALATRGVARAQPSLVRLRLEMGGLVALALQLLVAADALETLAKVPRRRMPSACRRYINSDTPIML